MLPSLKIVVEAKVYTKRVCCLILDIKKEFINTIIKINPPPISHHGQDWELIFLILQQLSQPLDINTFGIRFDKTFNGAN